MKYVAKLMLGTAVAVVALAVGNFARAAELAVGAEFRRALHEPVGPITWAERPLRAAVERLVETQHVAIMLDRRIDPDQRIDFAVQSAGLERLVAALVEPHGGSVCQVGPVLYVGPLATTQVLPTLVAKQQDKTRTLSTNLKSKLLRSTSWTWPRLSTPRTLLEELEADYGVIINGKENVPHDLWPAMQLPPLNFFEKLSLVLAGFHVTFDLSSAGDAVKLVAMPQSATLERTYSTPGDAQGIAAQLAPRFPAGKFSAGGKELTVIGPWEVHEAVARLLAGERVRPSPPPTRGKQVYTLTVENKPVGGVMRALATQLGKTVTFDDVQVQRRLTNEISLNVKDASLDELLHAVLDSANLKFEIQGDTIRVFD